MKTSGQFDTAWAHEVLDETAKLIVRNLPEIKHIFSILTETIFVHKAIARQLALAIAVETGAVTLSQFTHILKIILSRFSSRARLIRQLERNQRFQASTQDEWMDIAEQIDAIQGNDKWREEAECPLYESDRVSSRIDEFVHLMRRRDIFDLMFTLRGGIARNKFGLLHEQLFSKALAGSKVLVETYHNVICAALDFVCDAPIFPEEDPIPTEARLAFFNESRHAYGRTAMMFSGGAALGFYHMGVAKALIENGLMPRVLSGASAGSVVCAMIGTRTNDEIMIDLANVKGTVAQGHSGTLKFDFFRPLVRGKKENVKEEGMQSFHHRPLEKVGEVLHNTAGAFHSPRRTAIMYVPATLRRLIGFIYDIATGQARAKDVLKSDTDHFRNCCRTNIGNFTFQEAFDRTGRILNITVSPTNKSDPPRLLNYLTSPHVLVWSAAVASSSLPGVFDSNKLVVKDADGTERFECASGMKFQDGSMEADIPMQQLSEMFNINHFIISQVNPHAIMFSSIGLDQRSVWTSHLFGFSHGILTFLKNQIRAWFRHLAELVGGRRIAPLWETRRGLLTQFFTQEYVGRDSDITLNPWAKHRSLFSAIMHLLYNPSKEEFLDWIQAAERETWRYIPRLKSHCAVEMTLDRCVQRLRKRLLKESWDHHHTMTATASGGADKRMSARVPSFFTSPSLVNLGGLGVADQMNLAAWENTESNNNKVSSMIDEENGGGNNANHDCQAVNSDGHEWSTPMGHVDINLGWGGMGLQGNHSQASLARSEHSLGSGLFMMDGSDDEAELHIRKTTADAATSTEQDDRVLKTTLTPNHMKKQSSLDDIENADGYLKTTNMANFYYRKTKSHDNLKETNVFGL
mmetsp:Transcript_18556/g.27179  ORF Transcript_18556/g.27179 Transcript_18556/m.27179 type:complete len:860 (+) Transcript_18556:28-2607(+)|eukprot:CAMPEP_0195530742 /NCGR_PEP_ID=MMETSP0794_2-20130614/33772_1 /TAXON_ID=515487 /ORGANISM="Stephanopyxis turris, Strain CCMP 815" /LENGTH=859 /DNA_ID=CAMNT_0040662317 /DNA_START=23 /DNA_END=2602 /DNA_ORIENTATION=-